MCVCVSMYIYTYIFCFSEHKVTSLWYDNYFLKMFFPVPIWRNFHKNANCRYLPVTECAKENVTHVSVSFLQVRGFVFEQLMAAADLLLWICLKKIKTDNWVILYQYTIQGHYTHGARNYDDFYGDCLPNMRVLLVKFPYLHRKAITNRSTMDVCCSFHDLTLDC